MDWLTILVIVLLVLTLLDGAGYRTGWNERVAYGLGILVAVAIAVLVRRLFVRD